MVLDSAGPSSRIFEAASGPWWGTSSAVVRRHRSVQELKRGQVAVADIDVRGSA